jgi:hypothetical protein
MSFLASPLLRLIHMEPLTLLGSWALHMTKLLGRRQGQLMLRIPPKDVSFVEYLFWVG